MINVKNFLVTGISESYTIDKIDLTYSPELKTIGDNKLVMGILSVAFIDTNEITKERVNLFPSDVNSYYYEQAVGNEEQKMEYALNQTEKLYNSLNSGDDMPAIDFVLEKYNLHIDG